MSTSTTSRTEGQEREYRHLVENSAMHGVKLALDKIKVDSEGWQRVLVYGGEIRTAVAETIVAKTRELALGSVSQEHAREIMGRNFFGVEEAMRHFGVLPAKQQIAALNKIPFSEETLASCKDTHVLVAVFPMSILDIRGKVVGRKLFYGHEEVWYSKQAFAKDRCEIGWHLVRNALVANSTNKTWDEQQTFLSQDEETPKAQVLIYTIIGYFLATGDRLFENAYVRCLDLGSSGGRVFVGDFDGDGLDVSSY